MEPEIIGMEPQEIEEILTTLATTYNHEINGAIRGLYLGIFRNYTKQEITLALNEFLESDGGAFFPANPGQITKYAKKARNAKRLKYMPELNAAVAEIRGSLNSYAGPPKEYSHPLIDLCVRRLGFQGLCENTSAENQRVITFAFKEMLEHAIDSGTDEYTQEAERRALKAQSKQQLLEARKPKSLEA